ncbi:MAG: UDP-N-acetyl-D-mannosamine dehydrogenase [Methanoregulaceae archaeon PtaB.Bin108]|nr:MAG: UDP-N-acetyl-D-mannosamine dehydrogenase [Methanoregulaceae archaeon PtaB.Bin108]OPY43057.1 MAG: UDP-N-acetyl-D-mannosamine dehydrogenase [Methanoregulaceae archaeon PtaU1.Bin222]
MSELLSQLFREKGPIRTVGVVGMGYVGIPSAVLFADLPDIAKVYGFQRSSATSGYKIAMLNSGENPLRGDEPSLSVLLHRVAEEKKFTCTPDFSHISECDAVTIAIQTPFRNPKDLEPDLTPLLDGIRNVGRNLAPGALVVLESTITPGTTTGIAREILEEESGLTAGKDFGLAHAPERVMVGRLIRNLREHDRIVGGIDNASTQRAIELYSPLLTKGRIIPMTATAAEVEKTAENTFRDLQIAAANQLALYCEAMGVNFYDVREGVASLKEEGVTRGILWPGAGVGGHCLTKDTYHLERGVKVLGRPPDWPSGEQSLYLSARAINDFMPTHMFHLARDGLKRAEKKVKGSTFAILGWAFIADTDDARNTPSEVYKDLVISEGGEVRVHDPWVAKYQGVEISTDIEEVIRDSDIIAIFTSHKEYRMLDPVALKQGMGTAHPVIVDGRNVVNPDAFIQQGWIYQGIGRGDKNGHEIAK